MSSSHKEQQKRADFTLHQEIEAVNNLKRSSKDIIKAVSLLENRRGRIIVTGVGKQGFIAMKMAATLVSLGHQAQFLHPVEALHGDSGVVSGGDVIIVFSFSGESSEIIKITEHFRKNFSVSIIAITGNKKSTLGKIADVSVVIKIEKEGCPLDLAPMASTTAALVVGDLIASALTSPKDFGKFDFAKFHPGGTLGLRLSSVEKIMAEDKNIPIVGDDRALSEALEEISKKRLGVVGVVNKQRKIVGVITDGDIRRFLLRHLTIVGFKTDQMMTKNPKCIKRTDTLERALKEMEQYKITSLFVVDKDKRVEGVIHLHDILDNNLF